MRDYDIDSKEYWDKKWAFGENRRERCYLDGSDGEEEFDRELFKRTRGRMVLDEGCGSGTFTLKVGRKAKHVVGMDISSTALAQAERNLDRRKLANVEFRYGSATSVPYTEGSFDVVYSRRGPGTDSPKTVSEAHRVLRKGGYFMEITIGERDKQNIAKIFRRGQMLNVRGQVSDLKKRMLEKAGFSGVVTRDYIGTEVFKGMSDLLTRLKSAPIIPAFDPTRDRASLRQVAIQCKTERGLETPVHRVVLFGKK